MSTRTSENVVCMVALLKEEWHSSCWYVLEKFSVPKTIGHEIIRKDLGKRKLCARFMCHVLTREQ